jgi:succinyl-CoA synthetase beta subunit
VTRQDAGEMIDEIKSSLLLKGFRGRPKADIDALIDAVCHFSGMIEQLGAQILEAEINPLFVLPEGQGVKAADGVVIIRP